MTAPVSRPAFAHKLPHAVTFAAWRLRDTGMAHALELPPCDTLDEAIAAAMPSLGHKDRLFIRHTDEGRGKTVLHGWLVRRRSTPRYVRSEDGTRKAVYDLSLSDPFTMAMAAFAPERPFDAFRDDPRGVDLTLVAQGGGR